MNLVYAKEALKDLKKVKDKKLKERLKKVLLDLKEAENLIQIKSIKKMSGHPTAYRIRIGEYRLGFYFENKEIIITRFLKRSDIYKVFQNN